MRRSWLLGLLLAALAPGPSRAEPAPELPLPPGVHPEANAADALVDFTIDAGLDALVRDVLVRGGVTLGHVILLDTGTGEILSYVSTAPGRFPPTRAYPTASLMKVVTAAAVLRSRPEAARRDCRYLGSPYQLVAASLRAPARGGRLDSFWRALAISNNQCFARLAVHDLGEAALREEMERVGLLEAPAPAHDAGRALPTPGELELGYLGSGLAGSWVTPLGAARLAALLAAGELVHPYWIARVRDEQGRTLAVPDRTPPQRVWPETLARELRERMVAVTEEGTARRGFHDAGGRPLLGPVRVAGKTGTVSGTDPAGQYQWFVGVAPAEAPRVAVAALVVDDGRAGSARHTSASRVAAESLHAALCEGDACGTVRLEAMQARAQARDAAFAEELRTRELAALREAGLAVVARHEVVDLDRPPRPVGGASLELPRRLLRKKVSGRIVLLLDLSREGEVLDVAVDESDLPEFEEVVSSQVQGWRFTPPTRGGEPVAARTRLPIPIQVN